MSDKEARPVADAYRAFLSAKMKLRLAGAAAVQERLSANPDSIFGANRDYERPIWLAVYKALRSYHHPWNWEHDRPKEQFPDEMAFALA